MLLVSTSAKRDDDAPETKKYRQYKNDYAKHLLFDATQENLSKNMFA